VRSAVIAAFVFASGCASALRETVTPVPERALERELVTPVNRRIVVVVEFVSGHPPEVAALDGLTKLIGHYGERPAKWVKHGAPRSPPLRWEGEELRATGPLDDDASYVFVRYVGDELPHWGLAYVTYAGGRVVYCISINQERHRRWRGFIPERHLEQQTLVHEYGHLIGLPPSDHGYYPNYPDLVAGPHCVNPDCALALPRPRALLYGFFHTLIAKQYLEDYCATCRAAIAKAKSFFKNAPASRAVDR
jgi:hypothetical protein